MMEITSPQSGPVLDGQESGVSISRRGRVRKKSSKLLDFQSPDEVEKKPKRIVRPIRTGGGRGRPSLATTRARKALDETESFNDVTQDDEDIYDDLDGDANLEDEDQHGDGSFLAPDSEDELDELVADIVEGVEAESLENVNGESKVRQSLYMTEKANKRKILRDGKVVTRKVERKDKGKSRYTAYSLWAREFRKTSKFSKNQDLDFSNAARRLGELWANVSNKEKNAWRRKAKIQATKAKARDKVTVVNTISSSNTTFFNRATTSRTKKLAERQKTPPPTLPTNNLSINASKRKRNNSYKAPITSALLSMNSVATNNNNNNNSLSVFNTAQLTTSTYGNSQLTTNKKILALPNIDVIDAAAHLKLLGESLSIIGERLKEHEGQIAVSGSLSVLLDSLLCSLGPLLCLTTHIPGLEKKPQLSANLAATLDNIAYVMPGL